MNNELKPIKSPKKRFKKIMIGSTSIIAVLALAVVIFMNQPQFGRLPKGGDGKHRLPVAQ